MKLQHDEIWRRLARASAAGICLGVACVAGCRSSAEPQALMAPAVAVGSEVFAGSPLRGAGIPNGSPATAPVPGAAGGMPLVVEASWYYARADFPAPQRAESVPLASRATLVVSSADERPWQAAPRQLAGVRLLSGEPAVAAAQSLQAAPPASALALGASDAVIRPGLTASFRAGRQTALNGATTGPAPSATTAYVTPLAAIDSTSPGLQLMLSSEKAGATAEMVGIEWPGDPLIAPLVLFLPPEPGESGSIVLALSAREADPDTDAQLLAAADSRLAELSGAAPVLVVPSSLTVALQGAAAALADASSRRAALAFLARETEASLAEELALSADDAVLEALTKRLAVRWEQAIPVPAALGIELEREALGALAALDDAGSLPAEMRTLLTIHAGEAGRRAGSLQEALRGADSLAELRSILTAENTIYLEDSEAAARVRAFEWLEARGMAPAGYDPLASRESRRAALEAAMAEPVPQTRPNVNGGTR